MTDLKMRKRAAALMLVMLMTGLAVRLFIVRLPIASQIQLYLGDDAFYYFGIARNLAAGNPPSIDGTTATNGFHPLWMAACWAVFAAVRSPDLPIHILLVLAAVLDTASAFFLYRLTRRLFHKEWIALLVAALYLFNPWVFLKHMDGLETSLAVLLQVVFLASAWRAVRRGLIPRRAIHLGLLAGLLVLARTDLLLLALPVVVVVATRTRTPRRSALRRAALCVSVAALATIPWFVWSLQSFGSPVQVSGRALTPVLRSHFETSTGLDAGSVSGLVARLAFYARRLGHQARESGVGHIGLATLCGAAAVTMLARQRSRGRRYSLMSPRFLFLLVLWGFVPLYLGVHELVRFSVRPWYYCHGTPAVLVLVVFCLHRLSRAWESRIRSVRVVLVGTVALLFGLSIYDLADEVGYAWAKAMPVVAERIDSLGLKEGSVGAFNAGIFAYYSSVSVTNLDGLVNPAAFEALSHRRLLRYACAKGVEYLADQDAYIFGLYDGFWGAGPGPLRERLTLVDSVDSATEPFNIYRLDCSAPSGSRQPLTLLLGAQSAS